MLSFNKTPGRVAVLAAALVLLTSCGVRRAKYENPIGTTSEQPDKILFDKAIKDLEKGRYEVARLTLQALMNTYDTSEYLAKAKLAYADSWFREGTTHGLAQAEAEYKDFILFYPTMEEAAEAQQKVCMIHYRQMEKADRDTMHALRAESECTNLLVQFPNSKFAPGAEQLLRNIQEVIAEGEYRRGIFYANRGSYVSAASRLHAMTTHYPLFSKADEANWVLGDSYSRLNNRFREQAAEAFARIVREYPLSPRAEEAKQRLIAMEMAVPEADPVAYNRMKYELENRSGPSIASQAFGILKRGPDVSQAAKSGTPPMTPLRPAVPVSVPTPAATGFSGDVAITTVNEPGAGAAAETPAADPAGSSSTGAAATGTGEGQSVPAGAQPATGGNGNGGGTAAKSRQDNKKPEKKKAAK